MIHNLDLLIATLIGTTAIIIILFFLPAIIELKKPKDAGPRQINVDTTENRNLQPNKEISFSKGNKN
jgi:hypothetical protein